MEIEAHRATITEQRAQIEILRNVQANQARMDDEVRGRKMIPYFNCYLVIKCFQSHFGTLYHLIK
jgi:hypothetical protein